MDLSIPYEDGHLLVVDKPAGIVTHPAKGHITVPWSMDCWAARSPAVRTLTGRASYTAWTRTHRTADRRPR